MRMEYNCILFIQSSTPLFTLRVQHFITRIQNSQNDTIFRNLLFLVILHAFPHVFETS